MVEQQHGILRSIGDLSKQYGVSLRTLRFYEQFGLLTPERSGTKRLYSPKDEIRLQIVLVGCRLGFTLRDIKAIIEQYIGKNHADTGELLVALEPNQIITQIA